MAGTTATITVLMTDLVGSTGLLRHGPEAYDDIRRAHLAAVRQAVSPRGTEVKSTGDGLMATFTSAADAVACGEAVQQAVARLRRQDPRSPEVRVGISCGEATAEDNDWYGPPVIEAARLCAEADGGHVLTTAVVAALVGTRGAHSFEPLGERVLKGFDQPTSVVAVAWTPEAGAELPLPATAALSSGTCFVGRDHELERLRAAWKEARSGRRRLLLLAGEPGVGKTRLAAELARVAQEEGATVLWGRCDEELAVAYQPFSEALQTWRGGASETERSLLSEDPDLLRLLPDRERRGPDPSAPVVAVAADPEGDRLRLFGAVNDLLRRLAAESPVLLVLDDVHWATAPTLLLLRHLVRDPSPTPLLMVATYRDTDLDRAHPLAAMLADFRREANVERVAVGGLDESAVGEFVEATAGQQLDASGPELASVLHQQSEGNPFFVGQLLRHLAESGGVVQVDGGWRVSGPVDRLGIPEGVREVVGRRLSRLSDAANQTLRTAAVMGREFDLRTLTAVSDSSDADTVLDHVEEAVAAHLVDELRQTPGRFSFSHALVRQTLLSELTAARQARQHRRIGEAMAGQPGAPAAAVARHLCAGITEESAVAALRWTEEALRQAWQVTAFEEAFSIADEALQALDLLDHPPAEARARLLARMALSKQYQGAFEVSRALADRAIDAARATDDGVAFAEAVAARYGWARAGAGDQVATALISEAVERLGETDPVARASLLSTQALHRAVTLGEGRAAEPQGRQAVELARAAGDATTESSALFAWASTVQGTEELGVVDTAVSRFDELVAAAPAEEKWLYAFTRARLAVLAGVMRGERGAVEATLGLCRAEGRGDGRDRFVTAMVGMWQVMLDMADGDLDAAEAHLALVLPMAAVDPNFRNSWATLAFRIAYERGQAAGLAPNVRGAVEQTPGLVALRAVYALALIDAGEVGAAREVFADLAQDHFAAAPRDVVWSAILSQLTEGCLALDDRDAAADLYEFLLPFSGQLLVVAWGVYCPGAADRYLGALAGLLGRDDEIDGRFSAALEMEEGFSAPALAARTRVWWARGLAGRSRPGDAAQARDLLREARGVAEPRGLALLLAEADRVDARLSDRP